MSPTVIVLYSFGTIFFLSALAFAYYAFHNARLMYGPLGHQLMAVGGGLFIAATLVGAIDHFMFPGSGLVYVEFLIWVVGLAAIVSGGVLRVKEIQRVNRGSLVRVLSMMPNAKTYLVGITALVFVSLPLSAQSVLHPFNPEPNWFDAGNMVIWAFAFIPMAVAERRFYLVVRSPAVTTAGIGTREERLLREDILALRVCSDFAARLSAAIAPLVGVETLRTVLDQCAAEHDLLKGCEMTETGSLLTDRAAQRLLYVSEQRGGSETVAGFLELIPRFIDLYAAAASTEFAQEMVAKNYHAVRERHDDVSALSSILSALPQGFLEEEKLALLSKAELETKVRERTQELEAALARVRETTQALRASKASFHNIVQRSADGIVVIDQQGIVRFVNPSAESFMGRTAEDLVGEMAPIEPDSAAELDIVRENGKAGIAELRVIETEWEGKMAYLYLLHDITERVRADERIRASLKEKEVLLKEIHHRVKNNLQIISSLLSLQTGYTEDPQVTSTYEDIQNRIQSMALIHERLYRSKDLSRIDFDTYIQNLTTFLTNSYRVNPELVTTSISTNGVFLGIDAALPCGLILNELISNALKHAFPDGQAGEIHVEFCADRDHQFTLSVSDDGIGLPQDPDLSKTQSLGLQLVYDLVSQLNGTLALDRSRGTRFEIRFSTPA